MNAEDAGDEGPSKIHPQRHLAYMRPDATMTLREGLAEYYTTIDGLITEENADPEVAALFRFHDTCHVLFGCDTSIHGEALADTWSIFGTTVTLKTYQRYLSFSETQSIFKSMTFKDLLKAIGESVKGEVGIVAGELPSRLSGREPRGELARHDPLRGHLLGGGLHGQVVGVLVLRVAGVPPHPGELRLVVRERLPERLPEREVLDRATLARPAAALPSRRPLADPLHEVLGIGDDHEPEAIPLLPEELHRRDRPRQRHPIVGGGRGVQEEIPPLDATRGPGLDEAARTAGAVPGLAVAEARFIEMQDGDREGTGHQLSRTWKKSSSSRTKTSSSPVIAR